MLNTTGIPFDGLISLSALFPKRYYAWQQVIPNEKLKFTDNFMRLILLTASFHKQGLLQQANHRQLLHTVPPLHQVPRCILEVTTPMSMCVCVNYYLLVISCYYLKCDGSFSQGVRVGHSTAPQPLPRTPYRLVRWELPGLFSSCNYQEDCKKYAVFSRGRLYIWGSDSLDKNTHAIQIHHGGSSKLMY